MHTPSSSVVDGKSTPVRALIPRVPRSPVPPMTREFRVAQRLNGELKYRREVLQLEHVIAEQMPTMGATDLDRIIALTRLIDEQELKVLPETQAHHWASVEVYHKLQGEYVDLCERLKCAKRKCAAAYQAMRSKKVYIDALKSLKGKEEKSLSDSFPLDELDFTVEQPEPKRRRTDSSMLVVNVNRHRAIPFDAILSYDMAVGVEGLLHLLVYRDCTELIMQYAKF